jgi:8-oxo-dGTP pyrophosphatase MutT (NUDIX family)
MTPVHLASTVVLMRETTGEVLLVLRHGRHGFMANVWVFPGGRVDASDGAISGVDEGGPDLMRALVRAGIRETWEEAGILLSAPPREAREGEPRGLEALSRKSSYLEIEPFSRWVTPPSEKKRFDTVFFFGLVPELSARPDVDEVVEARWLTPADAIAQHQATGPAALALSPPTLVILTALAKFASPADALEWVRARRGEAMLPLEPQLVAEAGRLMVVSQTPFPVPGVTCCRVVLRAGHWELEAD